MSGDDRARGRGGGGPTVSDVAERAGLSFATTARALGGYGYVSRRARERAEAAAAELGYRRNDAARALASGTTRSVGLVVGDIENQYFATASRGLAQELEAAGFTLLLANSDEEPEREARVIEALLTQVDGLVVAPADSFGRERTRAQSKPLVLLDRIVRGLDVDCVGVDNAQASADAVRHLLGLGHTRIGVVSAPSSISSMSARVRGYRAALREAGMEPDDSLVGRGGFTPDGARETALRLLDRPDRPTALFTTDNFMTSGALMAVRELGLRVPDDVALVAFDDTEWFGLLETPITAIAQPALELGRACARLVLARLAGDASPPHRVQLRTTLIVRESCGASAAAARA